MGFDARYVPHAANVMASIMRHAPGAKLRFIVLVADVTAETEAAHGAAAPGRGVCLGRCRRRRPSGVCTRGHLNRTVLFRLGLETLAPEDCGRVIYVDADTIVLGDIREMWNVDLRRACAGGGDRLLSGRGQVCRAVVAAEGRAVFQLPACR